MEIRIAQEEDVPYLLDIYNYEVLHGEATFDINPRTLSERLDWYYAHNISNHPLIVAVEDGHAVGYACLSPYRVKEAYAATVELSVYVQGLPEARNCQEADAAYTEPGEGGRANPYRRFRDHRRKSGQHPSARGAWISALRDDQRSGREVWKVSGY